MTKAQRGGARRGAGRPRKLHGSKYRAAQRAAHVAAHCLVMRAVRAGLTVRSRSTRPRSALVAAVRATAWRLRLTVAPSRIPSAGAGVYVRCPACRWCPHRAAPAVTDAVTDAEADVRAQLCDGCATLSAAPVITQGECVGFYTGRRARSDAHGSYVLHVSILGTRLTLDAAQRGSMLKYVNGVAAEQAHGKEQANVRFAGAVGPHRVSKGANGVWRVPVVAARDLYAHEELLLDYGPEFSFAQ